MIGPVPAAAAQVIDIGCGISHNLAALGDGSPVITTPPHDEVAPPGSRTLLSVMAAGSPPLNFQWQYNGSALPGATRPWLRLANLQVPDSGSYAVVVSNVWGAVTSKTANLVVQSLLPLGLALNATNLLWSSAGNVPWFGETNLTHDGVAAARSGAIGNGQQSTLQTVVAGPGALTFWWKVSSEEFSNALSFALNGSVQAAISGEVDWQFQQFGIPPGTNILSWTYAKNSALSSGLDAGWLDQVSFGRAPIIHRQPLSQAVPIGTNVLLDVLASGTSPLSFQWLKDGTNLAGATAWFYSITNCARPDSGQYAVVVSDSGGAIHSSNAQVLVYVPLNLVSPTWLPQSGFSLLSREAGGSSLLAQDLASFEAQFSTNLVDWTSLSNSLTLTNGALLLADPQATNEAQGFYRILER